MRSLSAEGRLARLGVDTAWLVGVILVGVVLGAALIWDPVIVSLVAFGGVLFVAAVFWTHRCPSRAVSVAMGLVLVAGTKFRERDPTLSASGTLDTQILFELAVIGLIIAMLLVVRFSGAYVPERLRWVEMSLAGFATLAFASSLWSPVPLLSMVRAGQLLTLVTLAVVAIRVLGPVRTPGALVTGLLVYALLSSAISVAVPGISHGIQDPRGFNRFTWFSLHPIGVSMLTGLATSFLVARALFGSPPSRRVLRAAPWVWLIPLLAVLLATRSRGAMIAFAAAALTLVIRRYMHPWISVGVVCVVAAVVAVFPIVQLSPVDILDQLESAHGPLTQLVLRGQTPEEVMAFNGRFELWGALAKLIAHRPIMGHGYLSSRELMIGLISWATLGGYAHNELAQTLLDFGIIGTLMFWVPVLSAFATGPLRGAGIAPDVQVARATIFGGSVFVFLNAMTAEGLVAPPGFGMLTVCALAMSAARLRKLPTSA